MWRKKDFTLEALKYYLSINEVKKIIIIDNDFKERPKSEIFNSPKIKILNYGKNIYVNPAWNKGMENASEDLICICNDDIKIDKLIIEFASFYESRESHNLDLIGLGNLNYDGLAICPFEMDRSKPLGSQNGGRRFGHAMFLRKKNYKPIPNDIKIWFGDDYIVRNAKKVYRLNSNKLNLQIRSTIDSLNAEGINVDDIIKEDKINWYKKYLTLS